MLVRSQLRSLLESGVLNLTGLDPKDLVDTSKGVPNYHPSELPKIHIDFDTALSEEDTLDRSLSLIESSLSIRLFLVCTTQDFRKVLEDYSLEITYRIRAARIAETLDKLIDLSQIATTYELDAESSPVIGVVNNRYTMRYRL